MNLHIIGLKICIYKTVLGCVLRVAKKKKAREKEEEKEQIVNALRKKALGFDHDEIVEEYVCTEEGEIKLAKRKITKKFIPPDIPAAKILLGQFEKQLDFSVLTDEQLKEEKKRLMEELAQSIDEEEE